ncbi:MAG TPA: hypothetical protein VKV24_06355 [Casimicrobiaceae bacterium]|nr:hypothetical protein [Casimicrobiaceae bacterium]
MSPNSRRCLAIATLAIAGIVLAPAALAQAPSPNGAPRSGPPVPPVYKCHQADGTVLYQDYACKGAVVVDIKPDSADPAAIERLRREDAAFDQAAAQRHAIDAAARREQIGRAREVEAAQRDEERQARADEAAASYPGYFFVTPQRPFKTHRHDRPEHRPQIVPKHRPPSMLHREQPI